MAIPTSLNIPPNIIPQQLRLPTVASTGWLDVQIDEDTIQYSSEGIISKMNIPTRSMLQKVSIAFDTQYQRDLNKIVLAIFIHFVDITGTNALVCSHASAEKLTIDGETPSFDSRIIDRIKCSKDLNFKINFSESNEFPEVSISNLSE